MQWQTERPDVRISRALHNFGTSGRSMFRQLLLQTLCAHRFEICILRFGEGMSEEALSTKMLLLPTLGLPGIFQLLLSWGLGVVRLCLQSADCLARHTYNVLQSGFGSDLIQILLQRWSGFLSHSFALISNSPGATPGHSESMVIGWTQLPDSIWMPRSSTSSRG